MQDMLFKISIKTSTNRFQKTIVRSIVTNWYYAIDIPKRKTTKSKYSLTELPKEFKQFTRHDTERLRIAYNKYLTSTKKEDGTQVKVSEDKLFTVDFQKMELKPIYWDGPAYEVRRGIWFKSSNVPIAEDLATEIEELSHKFQKDDPDSGIFKLKTEKHDGINYVLFTSKEEAFLLPDLNGGSIHIKMLKSGIGHYLPIDGIRITRHANEKKKVKTDRGGRKDTSKQESSGNLTTKNPEQKSISLYTPTSWLNWDFYNQLSRLWDTKDTQTLSKDDTSTKDLSNNIESAYDDQDKSVESSHDREIRHLILCVHGIGQTLGKRYEYINFAHTVNLLRTNMKKLYGVSENLQKLNKFGNNIDWETNCGIQVLPITWRHSIGFETEPLEENNKKEDDFPTLSDITVNGILPLRKLLGDVAVDAILYEEPYYREKILTEVSEQLNRTFKLFKEMNQNFDGEVHLIGHSLGSVILFDILKDPRKYKLNFDVRKFFCLGSPVGLLKLIQRTRILPFNDSNKVKSDVNRLKCDDLYNIYHTCDPVAYRLEPLVHQSLKEINHKALPHFTELDGLTTKVLQVGGNILEKLPSSEEKVTGNQHSDDENDEEDSNSNKISPVVKDTLYKLNHLGRIDFAMTTNVFEVDMIAAIRSHVSYFEEPDIAGFILKEIIDKTSTKA